MQAVRVSSSSHGATLQSPIAQATCAATALLRPRSPPLGVERIVRLTRRGRECQSVAWGASIPRVRFHTARRALLERRTFFTPRTAIDSIT